MARTLLKFFVFSLNLGFVGEVQRGHGGMPLSGRGGGVDPKKGEAFHFRAFTAVSPTVGRGAPRSHSAADPGTPAAESALRREGLGWKEGPGSSPPARVGPPSSVLSEHDAVFQHGKYVGPADDAERSQHPEKGR